MTNAFRCLLLFALAGCYLSGAASAWAANYMVDPASAQASDTARCTTAAPCRTITAALALAGPGDTVVIASGVYREMLALRQGGDGPERPLVVRAAPGAQVNIKGSDVVTGWTAQGPGIWRKMDWPVNSQQVFVDGQALRQIGATSPFHKATNAGKTFLPAQGQGLKDLQVGSFFYDQAAKALYIRLAEGDDPANHHVEASVRLFGLVPREQGYVELHNLHFAHSNISAQGIYGSMVNIWGHHWRVRGCSFRQADFSGVSVVGEHHQIEDCEASDNGNIGMTVLGTDEAHGWKAVANRPDQSIVITGCRLRRNNTRGFDTAWQAGGLKASMSCSGIRLIGLEAMDNKGAGLWIDHFSRNIVVDRCLATGNSVGLAAEISDGILFRNNIAMRNTYGLMVAASSDVQIVNNTLHANENGALIHGLPRAEHPELRRIRIYNNLFSDNTTTDLIIYNDLTRGAAENTSDYNVFLRQSSQPVAAWTKGSSHGATHKALEDIRQDTQQEQHSVAGPSLFGAVKAPQDLHPPAGSRILDAGSTSVPLGDVDFFGHPRVVAATPGQPARPDVGAIERQAP